MKSFYSFIVLIITTFSLHTDAYGMEAEQIRQKIKLLELQETRLLTEIINKNSPTLTRKLFINMPKFLLKHAVYILGAAAVGAGTIMIINGDELATIRNAMLDRKSIFASFKEQAAHKVFNNPQFWGKASLSFIGSYLTLFILCEYLLKISNSTEQQEHLNQLSMLLKLHKQHLEELLQVK